MTAGSPSQPANAELATTSSLAPFRHASFAVLWSATVVSNIGTWMQNATAGWLMSGLNPDPLIVSLVQVASSLPIFLFAIPSGAISDIVDRRRLLIAIQCVVTVLVGAFAVMVARGLVTPVILLIFTLLAATAAALVMPAWQAIVPQLVPKRDLQPAVVLNSVGVNVSRAVGPALAGIIIAALGMAAPFWVNAVSTIGVIVALAWWRSDDQSAAPRLPAERFKGAVAAGLRHARHNPDLRATLIRAIGFFVFASCYWALLPLVARNQINGGPQLYGVLLGVIGVGAVAGSFGLPPLKRRLGPDNLAVAGTIGTAAALALFAIATVPAVALAASLIAGMSWIAFLATINVSAQVALPEWVRARGLSIFGTVMFGSLTIGSLLWGKVAGLLGLPAAHLAAAAGAAVTIPFLRHWKLQTGADLDLSPSMHWPTPGFFAEVDADRGPVLVSVEYRIATDHRHAFIEAICQLADSRCRDGAFEWQLFDDPAVPGRFVEIFMVDSWIEHLRQHHRVTAADRDLQEEVNRFQIDGAPKVIHLVATRRTRP